jgi:hypothetical protein
MLACLDQSGPTLRRTGLLLVVLSALPVAGCGDGVRTAAAVDADQARRTLKIVLNAWKQGESREALGQREPSIVVQDMDWKSGHALIAYELDGPGTTSDANLICPVKLTLRDRQGRQTRKTVEYIVGTDPVLTVFRKVF